MSSSETRESRKRTAPYVISASAAWRARIACNLFTVISDSDAYRPSYIPGGHLRMLDRQRDINPGRRWGDPWTLFVQPSE